MKLVVVALLAFGFTATAQEKFPASDTGMLSESILVPSIADQIKNGTAKFADNKKQKLRPKSRVVAKVVPGKGLPKGPDPLAEQQRSVTPSPVRAPNLVFEADTNSPFGVSDPTGAAGINHYVAAWNTGFRIFDKDGNALTPEMSLGTLFPGNTLGDPIVFFDANVDNGAGEPRGRFVITEFRNGGNPGGNGFDVAVSAGPDPVNDEWYIYQAQFNAPAFPDYTKFAVWGDSYIVTANITSASQRVFAVERNQMLENLPAQFAAFPLPGIVAQGFYSPHAFHTSGDQTVPAGTAAPIVFHQDDSFAGTTEDHLKIWGMTLDWANPANHAISLDQELFGADGVTPFLSVFDGGSFSNRPQPGGPDIDVLQNTVMNQVQYRRFGTHNSVIFNFVINTEGTSGELAGVRWYELRQDSDGMPWSVFQEGTYNAPDGRDAYSASMVMNSEGDIAMGYTSSSATDMISIRYTGRQSDDALNIMTSEEQIIGQSTASNPGNRLADYVHMTSDPVDDSFWHIAEYFNPGRNNVVGNFELLEPMPDDIGVLSIDSPNGDMYSDSEAVTISIRNFGNNDVVDPMVQYTINGGAPVVEQFSGTIAAGSTEAYTFTQTADLSVGAIFDICASTLLAGDSNTGNDETCITLVNTSDLECISAENTETQPVGPDAGAVTESVITIPQNGTILDVNVTINVNHTWNADMDIVLVGPEGTEVTLSSGNGGSSDNYNDTVFDDDATDLIGDGTGPFTGTFQPTGSLADFNGINAAGDWTLRITDNANADGGELLNWSLELCSDEVLSVVDTEVFEGSDLVISTNDNQHFDISLTTSYEGKTSINVYNLLGQQVIYNTLTKEGNQFNYSIDMSYAAKGVYIVKVNTLDGGSARSKKIIVK